MNYYRGRPKGAMRSSIERGDPRKFVGGYVGKLWMRASRGVTLNVTTISAIVDQFLLGNDLAGAGAAQPTFVAAESTLGGQPAADYDGTDDVMTGPVLSGLVSVGAYTVMAVVSVDAINTNNVNFELNDAIVSDGADGVFGLHLRSLPTAVAYNWDGSRDSASATVATGVGTVLTARHGGGTLGLQVNGGTEVTAASGNTTGLTHVLEVGRGGTTAYLDGKIGELLIFQTWVGSDIAARMRARLSSIYGVAQ